MAFERLCWEENSERSFEEAREEMLEEPRTGEIPM